MVGSDRYPLNSIGEFNPKLGIVSYELKEKYPARSACKAIWEKIVDITGEDNKKLQRINRGTRYILPKHKRWLPALLKFMGYEEIPPSELN